MAITFDTATIDTNYGPTSTPSVSYTATGSDLYVFAVVDVTTGTTATATWNGVAMTLIDTQSSNVGSTLYVFGLLAASSGTHNVAFTLSGSDSGRISIASWTGVMRQDTSSKGGSAVNTTTMTLTNTPTMDHTWTVGVFKSDSATGVAGASTTQRGSASSVIGIYDSNATQTPAGAVTLTATQTTNKWGGLIVALSADAANVGTGQMFLAF